MSYFMKLSAKEAAFLLYSIAQQRIVGKSWEAIADELKQSVVEIRQFLIERDAEFALWMKRARREHREFCVDEAIEKLRLQCQSNNEKARQSAASTILRYRMAELRDRENRRKAKLKKSLPPKNQKPVPVAPPAPQEAPAKPILKPTSTKVATTPSITFTELPVDLQQQTAELAKRLRI